MERKTQTICILYIYRGEYYIEIIKQKTFYNTADFLHGMKPNYCKHINFCLQLLIFAVLQSEQILTDINFFTVAKCDKLYIALK